MGIERLTWVQIGFATLVVMIPVGLLLSIPDLVDKVLLRGRTGRDLTLRLCIALGIWIVVFLGVGALGGYYFWTRGESRWVVILLPTLMVIPVLLIAWRLVRHVRSQ